MSEDRIHGSILLVGPDGAGKTSIADELERQLRERNVAVVRAHSRPGLLPGLRGQGGPVTDPHAQPPRGFAASLAKLALVLVDHLVGRFTSWRRAARRGVLIVERDWHDMAVDPARYRLPQPLGRMVLLLGRMLPRHDVTAVLDGPAEVLRQRKPELAQGEVERQSRCWARVASLTSRAVRHFDTTRRAPEEVAQCLLRELSEPGDERWIRVPIAPRRLDLSIYGGRSAVAALQIYRPLRPRARAAARVNVALVRMGIGRGTAKSVPRLAGLAKNVGLSYDGAVSFRSSVPGRYIVGLAQKGHLRWVLKLGPADDDALGREASALEYLAGSSRHFGVPHLVWAGAWEGSCAVVTEALPGAVAASRGIDRVAEICTELCKGDHGQPMIHGDLAPWNLLHWRGRSYLVDWEQWRPAFDPLYDLTHYVIRSGALLGWFTPEQAATLLTERGSPGWRHLEVLGVTPSRAADLVRSYVERRGVVAQPIDEFQRAVLASL